MKSTAITSIETVEFAFLQLFFELLFFRFIDSNDCLRRINSFLAQKQRNTEYRLAAHRCLCVRASVYESVCSSASEPECGSFCHWVFDDGFAGTIFEYAQEILGWLQKVIGGSSKCNFLFGKCDYFIVYIISIEGHHPRLAPATMIASSSPNLLGWIHRCATKQTEPNQTHWRNSCDTQQQTTDLLFKNICPPRTHVAGMCCVCMCVCAILWYDSRRTYRLGVILFTEIQ